MARMLTFRAFGLLSAMARRPYALFCAVLCVLPSPWGGGMVIGRLLGRRASSRAARAVSVSAERQRFFLTLFHREPGQRAHACRIQVTTENEACEQFTRRQAGQPRLFDSPFFSVCNYSTQDSKRLIPTLSCSYLN